jgi:transposase
MCSGSYGAALAWYLMGRGEDVREVPGSRTFRERRRKSSDGKSDDVDALAIARVVAREQNLPVPKQAGLMVDLKLLNDHRDHLVRARTRLSNQAHRELVILRPGYQKQVTTLRSKKYVRAALALLEGDVCVRAELTRERLLKRLELDDEIYRLGKGSRRC